jgi:hypothetical protein
MRRSPCVGRVAGGQARAALKAGDAAMDGFVGVIAGTVSPAEFFRADHIGQIFAAAPGDGHVPIATT